MKRKPHTPGTWIGDGEDTDGTLIVYSKWGTIARIPSCGDYLIDKSNAQLIAAAPDLLKACYLAAVRLESGSKAEREFNREIASKIRETIRKATR